MNNHKYIVLIIHIKWNKITKKKTKIKSNQNKKIDSIFNKSSQNSHKGDN